MKSKSIKYGIVGVIIIILLTAGVFAAKYLVPSVHATLEIADALSPFLDAKNFSMHLDLGATAEKELLELDANLYAISEEDKQYLVVEQKDASFYIVDNMLLLENGKAFLLTEEKDVMQSQGSVSELAVYRDVLPLIGAAYEEFEIVRTQTEDLVQYQIEVTGEQVHTILEATLSSKADMIQNIDSLQVQLTTKDGQLDTIQMKGMAHAGESNVSIAMLVSDFKLLTAGEYPIPQLIKDSMENVDKDTLFCLTGDMYRLIKAVEPLSNQEGLQGSMEWQLNCGIINIHSSIDLEKLSGLKEENTEPADETATAASIMQLAGAFIMEGELSSTEQNDRYIYQLALDEVAMKQLAETIAPEMVSYVVEFEKGNLTLTIEEETLSSVSIGIEGGLQVLISRIPVSIAVDLYLE